MAEADTAGTITWREVLAESTERLGAVGLPSQEARWIVEEIGGFDLDDLVTRRGMARHDELLRRRLSGEPLQYVLGHWSFRTLDLMVDPRVLIPRPETEAVVGHALDEFDRIVAGRSGEALVVDLGTGSGAIGFSIAVERVGARVWCTDRSPDALAVARANLSGIGRPARRVSLAEGSWFDALPGDLRGRLDLLVANPPYVAAGEPLPPEVADWEPHAALVPGNDGTEDLDVIVDGAPVWLAPGGSLVLELDPRQVDRLAERASAVGLVEVEARPDLAGSDRALVARRPA
jgi:release factor glutamine methyltransferase